MRYSLLLLGLMAGLFSSPAFATADGPDTFRVIDVAEGDSLNIRAAPDAKAEVIGTIPPDGDGIANLGCIGGLSYEEWSTATETERKAARKTRWCRVGYDRTIGWSAGWFLGEGTGEDSFRAGGRLKTLEGSEWGLRDLAGTPVSADAWIKFGPEGAVSGKSGCNRFAGKQAEAGAPSLFGPLASTRMACPDEQMETETRFFEVLGAAREIVAHHLVMAMFDGDGRLLATFARRDTD